MFNGRGRIHSVAWACVFLCCHKWCPQQNVSKDTVVSKEGSWLWLIPAVWHCMRSSQSIILGIGQSRSFRTDKRTGHRSSGHVSQLRIAVLDLTHCKLVLSNLKSATLTCHNQYAGIDSLSCSYAFQLSSFSWRDPPPASPRHSEHRY